MSIEFIQKVAHGDILGKIRPTLILALSGLACSLKYID